MLHDEAGKEIDVGGAEQGGVDYVIVILGRRV